MSALLLITALSAAPAELSGVLADGGIEIQGPRRAWLGRIIKRTRKANTIFVPRARINSQTETRDGVTYRTYNTKAGAYVAIAPGSARLRKHLRFRAGQAVATSSPVEQSSVETPIKTAPPDKAILARPIERLKAAASERQTGSSLMDNAPRTLGLLGLLAVGAAGIWWFRRKKFPELDGDSIEIVTTRVLGPKHRLSIIEAGGERLLIATSDNEVRLLSSLGAAPRFDEAPQFDAVEGELSVDEPTGEERSASEDVAGLIRLRAENESRDDDAARDFESVFRAVNSKQYVA